MNLSRVRVLSRRCVGEHLLLSYDWWGAEPEPGQFVGVRAEGSPFLPRPFFVHDWGEGEISLFIRIRGQGTQALASAGDEILVSAPRGAGFCTESVKDSGSVALIGGGVWVAPLKLLCRYLQKRDIPHDVFLEAPPEAPDEYLSWLGEAYPGAEVLSTDGSPGALIRAIESPGDYRAVYVSGDPATLRSASEVWAGAQLAVRERMACMDGSCYGCVVPVLSGGDVSYSRACVEGPVFRADELAW